MGTNFYLVCPHCGSRLLHLGKRIGVGDGKVKFISNWSKELLKKMLDEYWENSESKPLVFGEDGSIHLIFGFFKKLDEIDEWEIMKDAPAWGWS